MPKYIALLAGINLGKRRIKMDALKKHFESMVFQEVETVLATGNVIFVSKLRSAAKVESLVESGLHTRLGYEVATYVRTPDELACVVSNSPFGLADDKSDGFSVQVQFFKEPLLKKLAAPVSKIETATDRFAVVGRELYWRVTGRLSDSLVWSSAEMKAVSLPRGTTRNMNTVIKLTDSLHTR